MVRKLLSDTSVFVLNCTNSRKTNVITTLILNIYLNIQTIWDQLFQIMEMGSLALHFYLFFLPKISSSYCQYCSICPSPDEQT